MLKSYLNKMAGTTKSPPGVGIAEIIWSWVGAFAGIGAVSMISYKLLTGTGFTMILGSFGASAVLIYGAIKSPLAQPRNLIGGHVISALIGVTSYQLLNGDIWIAAPLAVATAIAVMHATKTLHPPGGATALIAVIGGQSVYKLGYVYAILPVGLGAVVMLFIALLVNNMPKNRRYPEFWF
jgi:CBS-domain-containing membrane protein